MARSGMPRKPRGRWPTRTQRALLDRIRKAGALYVCQPTDQEAYYYLPGNSIISTDSVKRLINNGWLFPVEDGLLPGVPQSYRATGGIKQ